MTQPTSANTLAPKMSALQQAIRAAALAIPKFFARRRQRLHLSELNAHLLADIGLTKDEAKGECAKPFWRA